jgi:hypothetical protein
MPLATEWVGGIDLAFDAVYGFRRYLNGAKCEGHTDRVGEQMFSPGLYGFY